MYLCVVALCRGAAFSPPVFSGNRFKSGKCWSMFLSGYASGPLEATLTQNNVLKKRAPGICRRCLHHPVVAKAVLWCCVMWHWTDPCCAAPLICGFTICQNISTYLKNTFTHTCTRTQTQLGENWMEVKFSFKFNSVISSSFKHSTVIRYAPTCLDWVWHYFLDKIKAIFYMCTLT